MPNYCNFQMRVRGAKESIETFKRYMDAEYDWSDHVLVSKEDHCFFRVFDTSLSFDQAPITDSDVVVASISGNCAWSVKVCFFAGPDTYYDSFLKEDRSPETFKGIGIEKASELLGLEIECFATEPGIGFMEHYYLDHGKLLTEVVYIDYTEVETEDGDWIAQGGIPIDFAF